MAIKKKAARNVLDLGRARIRKKVAAMPSGLQELAFRLVIERHPLIRAEPGLTALLLRCVQALLDATKDSEKAYEVAHALAELLRVTRDMTRAMAVPGDPTRVRPAELLRGRNIWRIFRPLEKKREDF